METKFTDLKGKTIKQIYGLKKDSQIVFIETADDTIYKMYHIQDCCEHVRIEDVNGNIEDLINSEILVAEERSEEAPDVSESGTWTFYTIRTIKGSVDIRWLGESNGYYSESVDFEIVKNKLYCVIFPEKLNLYTHYDIWESTSPIVAINRLLDWKKGKSPFRGEYEATLIETSEYPMIKIKKDNFTGCVSMREIYLED